MKKNLLCATLAAALAMPAFAMAAEEVSPNTGAIHFGADLNFTTSYFFRGYNQEDTGLIFQPNIYGYTDLITDADKNSVLTGLRAQVGLWSSLQSEQTASDGFWYETDLQASLTATFASDYYAALRFTYYAYPDDAFESVQELGVAGGIVDISKWWDKSETKSFTLPAEFGIYKEISDGNGDQDTYWELKVTPTIALGDETIPSFGKPTLSFPVVLGGSFDGYYTEDDGSNEEFGYVSVGANLGLPMKFVPAKYGSWTLNAGVNYIYLIADSAENANDGGEDYELQGNIGVSMTY
jgi:hypothetical protein